MTTEVSERVLAQFHLFGMARFTTLILPIPCRLHLLSGGRATASLVILPVYVPNGRPVGSYTLCDYPISQLRDGI